MWVGILASAYRSPHPPLPQPTDPRTVEDLSANLKPYQQKDWRHVPRFLTPLKPHTVTRAFLGQLRPQLSGMLSLVAQIVKNLPAMQETWVRSLGQEDPLEKEMATHSSILAWRIPWTEELGGLQSNRVTKSRTQLSQGASIF